MHAHQNSVFYSDKGRKDGRSPFTTTLRVDVIREVRAAARATKRTQSSILEEALHDYLCALPAHRRFNHVHFWRARNQLTSRARG
jgi:hypothetical protein